jgi:hypothetical protein
VKFFVSTWYGAKHFRFNLKCLRFLGSISEGKLAESKSQNPRNAKLPEKENGEMQFRGVWGM